MYLMYFGPLVEQYCTLFPYIYILVLALQVDFFFLDFFLKEFRKLIFFYSNKLYNIFSYPFSIPFKCIFKYMLKEK
jgi:hypothetical protein